MAESTGSVGSDRVTQSPVQKPNSNTQYEEIYIPVNTPWRERKQNESGTLDSYLVLEGKKKDLDRVSRNNPLRNATLRTPKQKYEMDDTRMQRTAALAKLHQAMYTAPVPHKVYKKKSMGGSILNSQEFFEEYIDEYERYKRNATINKAKKLRSALEKRAPPRKSIVVPTHLKSEYHFRSSMVGLSTRPTEEKYTWECTKLLEDRDPKPACSLSLENVRKSMMKLRLSRTVLGARPLSPLKQSGGISASTGITGKGKVVESLDTYIPPPESAIVRKPSLKESMSFSEDIQSHRNSPMNSFLERPSRPSSAIGIERVGSFDANGAVPGSSMSLYEAKSRMQSEMTDAGAHENFSLGAARADSDGAPSPVQVLERLQVDSLQSKTVG